MKQQFLVACLAVSAAFAGPATASNLIVAGDATIAARMVQAVATGSPTLAGNLTFAQNILSGGDRMSIYRFSVVNTFPNPPLGEQLAGVYNGFAGVTAATFDTDITAGALAGADLLVVLICPPQSGPATMVVWTVREIGNGQEAAHAGGDHREAA